MAVERLEGWLFDAYPDGDGIRVWIISADGSCRSVLDAWRYPFFIYPSNPEAGRRALACLKASKVPVTCRTVERIEVFSNQVLPVIEVRVPTTARDSLVAGLKRLDVRLFSADVHVVQAYHYERGHFPLARCAVSVQDGRAIAWDLNDDPWAIDYELPPLRIAHLALAGQEGSGSVDPNHAPHGKIVLSMDGKTHELEGDMAEQLETFAGHLNAWDPDVLTTDWGDSFLLPRLDAEADRLGMTLPWSRDERHRMAGRRERSFYTYGRAIYQGGARYLFGRWHLDLKNSFGLREYGLDGLFETARIASIPVQRAARCTIGTALSSMQMAHAWRNGILVPFEKQQSEDFRPAAELLEADKGGLVYEPEVGWYGNVAEFDFVSMYPTVMVRHNISPEAVNCPCCPENRVPGTRHHLCRRRKGLVPAVLEPILVKRAKYKTLAKQGGPTGPTYKRRSSAHKWILVVSFGYQGYRNAKFGKIESHECVTAWGREVLLLAKEAAEKRGLHILHAFVDALWVEVERGTDLEELRQAIEREAGCPLGLEGLYKWVRFCPSKEDKLSGVPNRYFGAYADGELKVRGVASRRHDTPAIIKALQADLLNRLARADSLADCRAMLPELEDIVEAYRYRLREGSVTAQELAISFNLSKEPNEYVNNTVSSLAAKQLAASGVKLHVGESVSYIITSSGDKVKEWRSKPLAIMGEVLEYDGKKYLELLERGANEILDGLTDAKRSDGATSRPRGKGAPRRKDRQSQELWLTGFEA